MKTKRFMILKLGETLDAPISIEETIEGTIEDARKAVTSEAHADGEYAIAEYVTLVTKKTVHTAPVTKITFEPTRKRPRKAKPEVAEAKAAKGSK